MVASKHFSHVTFYAGDEESALYVKKVGKNAALGKKLYRLY